MPTPTYTPLATITLTGTDTEISIGSIPDSYRDLVIACSLRTNRSANDEPVRVRFNGDSTNGNYTRIAVYANGSSVGSYQDSPGEIIVDTAAAAASATSGIFSVFNFTVFDYAQTNKHKSVITVSDLATVETRRQSARWASTTAINAITITPYFGNSFVAGSTVSIYAIAS